jgi:hypothetical protein
MANSAISEDRVSVSGREFGDLLVRSRGDVAVHLGGVLLVLASEDQHEIVAYLDFFGGSGSLQIDGVGVDVCELVASSLA